MTIMETNIMSTTTPSTKITTKEIGQSAKYISGIGKLCKGPDSKNFMRCGLYSLCNKYSTLQCRVKTAIDSM